MNFRTKSRNRLRRLLAFLLVFQSFLIGFCDCCCAVSSCCAVASCCEGQEDICEASESCCDASELGCCGAASGCQLNIVSSGNGELTCCSCNLQPSESAPAVLAAAELLELQNTHAFGRPLTSGFPAPSSVRCRDVDIRSPHVLTGNSLQSLLCIWRH